MQEGTQATNLHKQKASQGFPSSSRPFIASYFPMSFRPNLYIPYISPHQLSLILITVTFSSQDIGNSLHQPNTNDEEDVIWRSKQNVSPYPSNVTCELR